MRRIGILLLLVIAGCASNAARLTGMDADALLQYALERKAAGKWTDASQALEQFVFQFPTHPRLQEARFNLGQVYMEKKDYLIAASEFGRLAEDYPNGPYADDARFQVCLAYYQLSPKPALTQEYTQTAIDQCRTMAAIYPESEFAARAQEIVKELRNRLAVKLYMNGEHYFKRNGIDPAIIYYNKILSDYPDTPTAAKALMRLYESYTKIGFTDEAKETRERLLQDYPESAEAQRLKADTTSARA